MDGGMADGTDEKNTMVPRGVAGGDEGDHDQLGCSAGGHDVAAHAVVQHVVPGTRNVPVVKNMDSCRGMEPSPRVRKAAQASPQSDAHTVENWSSVSDNGATTR